MDETETPEEAARRELREETGVDFSGRLRQFGVFGAPNRDVRKHEGFDPFRVVSIAFYAFVSTFRTRLEAGGDARRVGWFEAAIVGPRSRKTAMLAFDHADIIRSALVSLRDDLAANPALVLDVLEPEFTLSELQRAYERVDGEKRDAARFRKWIRAAAHIEETGRTRSRPTDQSGRPEKTFRSTGRARRSGPAAKAR